MVGVRSMRALGGGEMTGVVDVTGSDDGWTDGGL